MKRVSFFVYIITVVILFHSCSKPKPTRGDTSTSGIAYVAIDECLAPILQQEINVFEMKYNEATIMPSYTNEFNAYDLLVKDSLRLVFGARDLTEYEKQVIRENKRTPRTQRIAVDGIALIINKANTDTLISVADIRRIMSGEVRTWNSLYPESKLGEIAIGFDSPNSSTVRFIKESINGGKPLGENVVAKSVDQEYIEIDGATPSQKVINFVASTPNALGIIGVSWISNPADSTNLSFIDDIRVMSVSEEDVATRSNSYKPYAAYLALEKYPLRRDIYSIITDIRGGLPSGFLNFVAGDQGQRIIVKSGLMPATRPSRIVNIKSTTSD